VTGHHLVRRAPPRAGEPTAEEPTADELAAGGRPLTAKAEWRRPGRLAVPGATAYRVVLGDERARIGPRERTIGDTRIRALPCPSGLCAHRTPTTPAEEPGRPRAPAFAPSAA
jgi:TDG/mug DNA glycosylase family protein